MEDITPSDYVKFLTPDGWSNNIPIYDLLIAGESDKLTDIASFCIRLVDMPKAVEISTTSVHVFSADITFMGRIKYFMLGSKLINFNLRS